MFSMALGFIVIFAPLQIVIGDVLGINTLHYQPAKIAAIEAVWDESKKGAPLLLFAIPSEKTESNSYEIAIPKLTSLILTHSLEGEIKGLKSFAPDLRPPVAPVFFCFRIMVMMGFAMLFAALIGAVLFFRKKLFTTKWFLYYAMLLTPSGFIAILAGWFVTEIGRQPYIVYGFLRTREILSSASYEQVLFSLILFVLVYFIIFGAATYYILRLISKGPKG